MKTVSILVADDHEMVRQGLCSLLEIETGWKTVEANDGREAVVKATQLRPDVVIMDIDMPRLNGLAATREIRKELPCLPVVVLSGYSAQALVDNALAAGVRGYLFKTDAAKNLISAVKAVLQGNTFFTATISNRLLECSRRSCSRDTASLTKRETEITRLLCEGKANKEVAYELGISARTVANHRAHIMEKLDLSSFSDLMRYAIKNAIVQA